MFTAPSTHVSPPPRVVPSTPAVPPALITLARWSGLAAAAVLVVNTVKRAGILPLVPATQLVAPLAEVLALLFVTGLFLRAGHRSGGWGVAAYAANVTALGLLVGVEFVINLVFGGRTVAEIGVLRSGSLGIALIATSVVFLVATIAFAATMAAERSVPRWSLVAYAVGGALVASRAFVPEWALQVGLLVLASGIVGPSVWLLRAGRSRALTTRFVPTGAPTGAA